MALDPVGTGISHNWNYSRPNDPGFSLSLTGTVVAIQEVQAMNFSSDGRPTTPQFWENTNQPKMNIRMVLCGPSGGYRTWTFQPASRAAKEGKKKSVHIDLYNLTNGKGLMSLIGQTIKITTQAPPEGFGYGKNNPRPWHVELVPGVKYELKEPLDPIYLMPKVLADGAVSGGSMNVPVSVQYAVAQNDHQAPATTTDQPETGNAFADDEIPF